ncbi:MAG: PASTA domain-containing protein [Gaiellaceae bacterium]
MIGVSEFIEECRGEWKRLRVPEPAMDEMAAELAADLQDAEADGVAASDVLGVGASDPRAFAASWAAERGVIYPRWQDKVRRPHLVVGGVVLVVALAAVGATLAISSSSPRSGVPATTATAPVTTITASQVVPDVTGLQKTEAIAVAQAAGLSIHVTLHKHTSQPAGTVLDQTPPAGETVARGATVALVVAGR